MKVVASYSLHYYLPVTATAENHEDTQIKPGWEKTAQRERDYGSPPYPAGSNARVFPKAFCPFRQAKQADDETPKVIFKPVAQRRIK